MTMADATEITTSRAAVLLGLASGTFVPRDGFPRRQGPGEEDGGDGMSGGLKDDPKPLPLHRR